MSLLGSSGKGGVKMGAQAVPDLCHKMADTPLLFEREKKRRINSDENLQKTELCFPPPAPLKLGHLARSWGGRHRLKPLCSGPASLQAETLTAQGCGCPQPWLYNWGRGKTKTHKETGCKRSRKMKNPTQSLFFLLPHSLSFLTLQKQVTPLSHSRACFL